MNTMPEELTPDIQSLAQRLAGLPFAGPDAAARSRMRVAFEATLAAPRAPWWARPLYLGAIAGALALGLGAAGAASRSPVDVVRDPGGVVQDIVRNVSGEKPQPAIVICDDDDNDPGTRGGDDCDDDRDDGNSGPGSSDDDDRDDDNSGPGSGDDDDDNSGPGSSDDDDDGDDDSSGPGSGDDDDRDDDSSGSGSRDNDDRDDDSSGPGSSDDDDGDGEDGD